MADHSLPTTTNLYADVLTYLDARLDDLSRWNGTAYTTPTNLITGAIRWNATTFRWDTWNLTDWNTPLTSRLDVNINGTVGATTPNTGAFTTLSSSSTTNLATGATVNSIPIVTTTGTQTLSNKTLDSTSTWNGGVIGVLYGGTGSSTAAGAAFALKGANSDITSISTITGLGNGATTHLQITSAGVLGVGVAPATWSGLTGLQIAASGLVAFSGTAGDVTSNTYYNAGYKYIGTGLATRYTQSAGTHAWWYTGTSGTAGGAITFVEGMRLDASGNLGIGAASTTYSLEVTKNQNATTAIVIRNTDAGASATSTLQLTNNTKSVNFVMNGSSSSLAIQGQGGTTTKYDDFDTHIWRNVAGTEKMRLNATTTGALWLGTTSPGAVQLALYNNITGATSAFGYTTNSTIQSDVTSSAYGYNTSLSTQAAAFTLGSLIHYNASQGTIGAGSAVTNQYGFYAGSSLAAGSTSTIGFYSDIASGTGKWNFYANGTANNYMNGSLGVGTTSSTNKLQVYTTGTAVAAFTGATAASYAEVTIASNDRSLTLGQRSSTNASGDLAYIYTATTTPFAIFTNSVQRLTVSATGDVTLNTAGATLAGVATISGTPNFSGAATGQTATAGDSTTKLATTAYVTGATVTAANGLKSATTTVSVSAATAPSANQVLMATSSTAATWQAIPSVSLTTGVTGTLPIANGGTNATTAANARLNLQTMQYIGTWASGTTYQKNQVVNYNGGAYSGIYICLLDNTTGGANGPTDGSSNAKWSCMLAVSVSAGTGGGGNGPT